MIKTIGLFNVKEITNTPKYSPINLEYFLDMELAMGSGGKEIIKQNHLENRKKISIKSDT